MPWYKNFRGSIHELDNQRFVITGEIGRLENNKYEISELPIKVWTQPYKESVMEPLLNGKEKKEEKGKDKKEEKGVPAIIS